MHASSWLLPTLGRRKILAGQGSEALIQQPSLECCLTCINVHHLHLGSTTMTSLVARTSLSTCSRFSFLPGIQHRCHHVTVVVGTGSRSAWSPASARPGLTGLRVGLVPEDVVLHPQHVGGHGLV